MHLADEAFKKGVSLVIKSPLIPLLIGAKETLESGVAHHQPFDGVLLHNRFQLVHQAVGQVVAHEIR